MPPIDAGSIYSEVRIRLDKLKQDIVEVTANFDKLGTNVTTSTEKASKKVQSSFNAMSIASIAASAAIVTAFRSMITTTAEYSAAMSGVQSATRGTAEELAQLESAAESAGDGMATSTTDALGAVEALAKAGVGTADIMGGALTGALTLAAAGSMEVSDAAEIAAATMTQFGLAGSDVTHIADLLAAGAGKAQGEVSDLSQALKQAGLVASQTGLSVDDTVGSLAAFASAGLLGSDAGTSFRTMLLRLTPQSKEAAVEMKKLGLNAFDAKGEFIGITAFAGQLKDQLKNLTTEQRNSALATIFGSDSIRAANVLYTQGAEGIASWIDKVNDSGFAAETARIKLDNLAGDMKKFDAATTDAAVAVGKGLNPGLRLLTQFGTAVLDFFAKLPTPVLAFITTIGTLGGGLLVVTAAGSALIPVLVGIGTAAAAALGPVGLIVAGIGALAVGAVAAGNAINDNLNQEAFNKFKDIAESAGASGEALAKFGEQARKAEDQLQNIVDNGTKLTAEGFKAIAKYAGLTNDQLAQLVTRSSKSTAQMRELAQSFIDPIRVQKEFAAAQKASADAIVGRYEKLSAAGKAAADKLLPTVKTISDAIAYQNYLENVGLITAEESLTAKIKLREDEIEKIQKAGEETRKLSATEEAQVKVLQGFNAENQADLDKIKKTREDTAKVQETAAQLEKASRDKISAALSSETEKIIQNRNELLAANNAIIQSEQDRVNAEIAINAQAEEKLAAIRKAAQDKEDKLVEDGAKKQQDAFKSIADFAFSTFNGLLSALSDIFASLNQRQVDDLTDRYDAERELIENNGLTKQQALEKELDDARAGGDAEKIAEAEKNLELFKLETEFTRKKAQLEYDAAKQSWALQVAMAIAQAAQAALAAYSSTAAIPIIGPGLAPFAAAAAGAVGALQVGAVFAAQPQPPKFETGGIVLGNSFTGDKVPALVNSGEMILNREQQAELFNMANGQGSGRGEITVVVPVSLDGKVIATSTAKLIDDGIVPLRSLNR